MKIACPWGVAYAYTGGRPWVQGQPTVLLIHGVLNDHSVWILQSRYLAHHGCNVLALDLPGHGRSGGHPCDSIQAYAAAMLQCLDAAGVDTCAVAGHSMGSLIGLEMAAQAPARVTRLAMVATAYPMRVAPALLQAAQDDPPRAMAMVTTFSHSTLAPPPSALGPGTWTHGALDALMRRVLASNTEHNVFVEGFKACDSYQGAPEALAQVRCPVRLVLGTRDQMTPPKAAASIQAALPTAETVLVQAGHALMTEAPEATLRALHPWLLAS